MTTFRESAKVAALLLTYVVPTPSGPSAVSAASGGKLLTYIHATVRVECRACKPDLPHVVSRR
jgi:hypothetical protein